MISPVSVSTIEPSAPSVTSTFFTPPCSNLLAAATISSLLLLQLRQYFCTSKASIMIARLKHLGRGRHLCEVLKLRLIGRTEGDAGSELGGERPVIASHIHQHINSTFLGVLRNENVYPLWNLALQHHARLDTISQTSDYVIL
jgi:hypothetical protein